MKRRRRFMFQSAGLEIATYSLKAEENAALEDAARDFEQFLAAVRSEGQITCSIGEIEALHEKLSNASEIIERLALTGWRNRRELGVIRNGIDEKGEA